MATTPDETPRLVAEEKPGDNALALTIPLVSSYVWLAFIPSFRAFEASTRPLDRDFAAGTLWFALVCATAASFITMIWLILYRGRDISEAQARVGAFNDLPAFLVDRRVWYLERYHQRA